MARAAGARTILNPAPASADLKQLLSLVDVCIPNETELALLSGLPTGSRAEIEKAVAALMLASGVGCVVTTLGGEGGM